MIWLKRALQKWLEIKPAPAPTINTSIVFKDGTSRQIAGDVARRGWVASNRNL